MLAVVTCLFNIANFSRPQANLHRFLRQMKQCGVPVYGVEAKLFQHVSATETSTWTKWVNFNLGHRTQMVWQKEACLNAAEKLVPPEYDNIAWVDADVWFENPTWAEDTEKALEEFDVVQMFEMAHWTSKSGKVELTRPSVAKKELNARWSSHPGFAWAMRRSVWREGGGLYPFTVSGGCDTLMAVTFSGQKHWREIEGHMGANPSTFHQWAEGYRGVKLGCVPGDLYHEWHGSRTDRQYKERMELMMRVNHEEHLQLADNGLLCWTEKAPQATITSAARYFVTRKEDG